jgi:uncharacterized protein
MKALYITSVEAFSGKSAIVMALGKHIQSQGKQVGYLKPVSTQPWRTPEGKLADEDAAFINNVLNLTDDPTELCPVIVTPSALRSQLKGVGTEDNLNRILEAAKKVSTGKDLLLLEGGASLREGHAMGLSNLKIAQALGAPVLVLVSYHGEMQVIDDALTVKLRLKDQCLGVIINRVPAGAEEFIQEYATPHLQSQGVPVLGMLPSLPKLSALSVGELIELLNAEVLTDQVNLDALAENFTVGAMTLDAALSRFRKQRSKAVITGGDRTDIQLAALETSTVVLILTGNLHPSPLVLKQAENLNVPVLLVKGNTMETVESIEQSYGKTRLGQSEKLDTFVNLLKQNIDVDAILEEIV